MHRNLGYLKLLHVSLTPSQSIFVAFISYLYYLDELLVAIMRDSDCFLLLIGEKGETSICPLVMLRIASPSALAIYFGARPS